MTLGTLMTSRRCTSARRWRNTCTDLHTQPRANLDSDHFPVVVSFRIKLGGHRRQVKHTTRNFRGATQPQIEAMNSAIAQELSTNLHCVGDSTTRWDNLQQVYLRSIDSHVPKQHSKPKQPWITPDALQLITQRGHYRIGPSC